MKGCESSPKDTKRSLSERFDLYCRRVIYRSTYNTVFKQKKYLYRQWCGEDVEPEEEIKEGIEDDLCAVRLSVRGYEVTLHYPELAELVMELQARKREILLLNEIIGLSLIQSTEKMRREDTPLVNALLRKTIGEYEDVANKGVELKLETTLADDLKIKTNENMLKRIVAALLENACKYTEKGSITLRASETDQRLCITVEDTGCGIPKKDADKIFERFE